ncbi:S41 family peptidase [Wenzhouxiangella sp. EGI_FJ10305]|uniref:S41 family peptidase n=1 Tax=Wenzhouxiangella sp. EGI_FJ10305 TaxID=3243768 RepID=UPI0035D9DEBC
MKSIVSCVSAALVLFGVSEVFASDDGEPTRLLSHPAVSADHLAFVYAGDLWISDRDGNEPRRLTSAAAEENNPYFSPDGKRIAYAAEYEGNTDVYIIDVDGGQPMRLTWHPGSDVPVGWSADGSEVAFASRRETDHGRSAQLWHVPVDGGAPARQMEARFFRGRWDQDGERLAYIDHGPAYNGLYGGSAGWRGYRGGTTPSIRIIEPGEGDVVDVPGDRVNDIQPFWMGEQVVFISDRHEKRLNLHAFDTASGEIERLTDQADWDVHWADGHGEHIVFEAGGELHELNIASGERRTLEIALNPDLPQQRTEWQSVQGNIERVGISPNGKRVLVTARGEIFTVPVEHGSTRNLTVSDGQREYPALWSPEGDRIAWIVESLDGQELVVADQHGEVSERHELGADFYQLEAWDASEGRIAYSDNGVSLFVIDLEDGDRDEIARSARMGNYDVAFSPDGQWLAYTLNRDNYLSDLMVHDFDSGQSTRVSDGMADVASPVFSRDGKYLYMAASTNAGPIQFGLDMSTQERPYRAGIYALVLAEDAESPLAPRTGDEEPDEENGDENGDKNGEDNGKDKDDKDVEVRIDFDGLAERMVALPVAKGNYRGLQVAGDGSLFWMRYPQPGSTVEMPGENRVDENRLMRFDFEKREASTVFTGLNSFDISSAGSHLLVSSNGSVQVAEAGEKIEPEAVDLSGLRMRIDPEAEWAQIFDEGWRMQKEFFYADNLHGLDWDAVYEQYRPLVGHVGRREDLNALMVEMIAELHAGHNRVGGGDVHSESGPGAGLLGANFTIENDRWRIERIYTGESWNAFLQGPLNQPGNEARVGEYILAVNGREITADDNLYEHLYNTVGEQVILTVGPDPDGDDAREIIVEPVDSEGELRLWAWVEGNRKAVDEATDGRVGYVYLPNTAGAGYTFFNRMFFAQLDREAVIIDERGNGGGQAADYIVEVLSRPHLSNWVYRHGEISRTPFGAMHGPKLMMIDQDAGSGGDYLPYAFRELDIGPLLGTRTWGGLIGIYANPGFVDGGTMTVPHFRFVDADNNWSVENEGVAPDIAVELDPVATNNGRDSQLQAAIEQIRAMLEDHSDDIPDEAPPLPTELGR